MFAVNTEYPKQHYSAGVNATAAFMKYKFTTLTPTRYEINLLIHIISVLL